MLRTLITIGIAWLSISCMNETASPAQDVLAAGKKVYDANCLTCHQKDGYGVPRLNASLVKSKVVNGDKKKLIRVILLGSQKAGVHDEEYNNPMPAQPHLSDEEIANVLTYIRNSFGNQATPVIAKEVKQLRTK